ncbi:MAG: DUF1922 domain-containing protein [Promethearchaeota archaeon]|nr:MAG: DUF1922 domain-containing protein [Candidatus Lokiarchaeota archaeon]
MYSPKKYFFFRCYHCGNWFYTKKLIKTKKCVRCNRTFQFQNAMKFSKLCSGYEAIRMLQELKKREAEETLSKHLKQKSNLSTF